MFVVCPKPHANCFRVVRRSIFGRREWCLAPESRLSRKNGWWCFSGQRRARSLVVTGNLLAHPRSLAMLGWPDVPLRSAVPLNVDPLLDTALAQICEMDASVRWNLMLELPRC